MPIIKTELPQNEKAAFRHFSKSQGMTEAEMLRQMVRRVLGDQVENPPAEQIERGNRTTLSFTEDEMWAITKRSRADGFTRHTAWLVGLVRAVLFREPTFSSEEMEVLRESNRELAAIGRNLNQIARGINVDFREGERIKRAEIQSLAEQLADHREIVSRLIDKSLNRWSTADE